MNTSMQDSSTERVSETTEVRDGTSTYTGYIQRTFLQLDGAGQEALSTYAACLLRQQREEEKVRDQGGMTLDQLRTMTLSELQEYARGLGVRASSVIRVAEASAT